MVNINHKGSVDFFEIEKENSVMPWVITIVIIFVLVAAVN